MKFREFLEHRIPMREIIVGHYPTLAGLARTGEPLGVLIRHRWVVNYPAGIPFYEADVSYPTRSDSTEDELDGNHHTVPKYFSRLFVVNSRSADPRVTAIPSGVYPNLHPWQIAIALRGSEKRELVYANFSLGARVQPEYFRRRLRVYANIRRHGWITFENMGNENGVYDLGMTEYYRRVAAHRFTISPQGNGGDCHRTWEALYLRSILIVQRSAEMEHFADLSILFTDDYTELTPEYLEEEYSRMLETDYAIEKLYLSYWRDQIAAAIEQHRDDRAGARVA